MCLNDDFASRETMVVIAEKWWWLWQRNDGGYGREMVVVMVEKWWSWQKKVDIVRIEN